MDEVENVFEEIEASFDALRRAVEERNYSSLQLLLRKQQCLMSLVPVSHQQAQSLSLRGSALISWALTMVKIQHAGYIHEVANILNARYLNAQYRDTASLRQELISVTA